jgi:hypothetical protein
MMKALQTYIDNKNRWNAIFKGEQFELESAEGRKRVAQSLDADLSPENLTCDGELSRKEIEMRYRLLHEAAVQLAALDPVAANAIYELYTGE